MNRNGSRRIGTIVLADGTSFYGPAFGREVAIEDAVVAEAVFNTAMYGYQEITTDPSYAGQIMCFTSPHIGNVGANEEDVESSKVWVSGVLVRALSEEASNFRASQTFDEYLRKAKVMGLSGIDTRALTKHLRDHGSQMAAMAVTGGIPTKEQIATLTQKACAAGSMLGKDYVHAVTCKTPYTWSELPWSLALTGKGKETLTQEQTSSRPHVIAVDCGIKHNILRLLLDTGFRVTVVPASYSAEQILALQPDALFLSNGPGDPATLGYIVDTVKTLVGRFPIFGICLGHQILAQVFGGKTYKLKFGHRGGNHPVKDLTTGKVEITVQNHGFAVVPDSLPANVQVTHINLNDQTIEGLAVPSARAFSVQYHPESSPGPHDSKYLFRKFFESVVHYSAPLAA